MQKFELLKLLFGTNGQLLKQKRLIQTSVKIFDDGKKIQPIYEEYDEPFTSVNIKGLEDMGILKTHWSWPKYNRIIYPPQKEGEPKVTPFVHHMRSYIKYSPKKMWLTASMVRNLARLFFSYSINLQT